MTPTNMPEPLASEYHELWQEIAALHQTWTEYEALFGRDAARVDALNWAAPRFFGIVERTMWADLILHLSRVTSKKKSAGHSVLTVRRLPELCDSAIAQDVQAAVDIAVRTADFCRDPRDRFYAHLDLDVALNREQANFTLGSRLQFKKALAALVHVLNAVSLHYHQTLNEFDLFPDADRLVKLIEASRLVKASPSCQA